MSSRIPGSPAVAALPQQASSGPENAKMVLISLILVAAVANLNLSVANVALPSIGKAFDASQTELNLVAVAYSLGLASSVLWLGALGDRYGRKMMLLIGILLSVPACLIAAYAGSIEVLIGGRLLGGVSAGMAYPTTLALIAALWTGQARTKSIALWSATGGAIAACGPVVAGFLLEHFSWRSVFVITLPLAAVALLMAWKFVPAHVHETTEPVDNLGGVLSMVLVGTLILGINFAPVPNELALAAGLFAVAIVATVLFLYRQRKAKNPLYDLNVARRRVFWVAAVAGIVVFGSLMGAMFIGQQYLQNVLDYSTLDAGLAILPAAARDDRGGAAIGQAGRVPRRAHHVAGRLCLCAGRFRHDAAALERECLVLEGRFGVCADWYRRRVRGNACLALADRIGAGDPGGHGLGHRRSAARSGRRHHAIDLRRVADGRICRGDGRSIAAAPNGDQSVTPQRRSQLHKSFSSAEETAEQYPEYSDRDHRGSPEVLPRWRPVGVYGRHHRGAHRWGVGLLHVPEEGRRGSAAGPIPCRGCEGVCRGSGSGSTTSDQR